MLFAKHWDISEKTQYLLGSCDAMVKAICQTPLQPESRRRLLNVALIRGAQATTAIEGNTLTEAEIEKVSAGVSLAASKKYQEREVRNILDAMNEILRAIVVDGTSNLISADLIRSFHSRVGSELGEHFDAVPGQFRTDNRVVGPYRCPRPQDISDLLECLCKWLAAEFGYATNQQTFPQAVIQAIVTHVYLEWIHPFGDGNGRTGRLLEFYILMRAGNPDIASHILSNHYNETRAEYYRQLDQASKTRDLTTFITYAIQGYYDGLNDVLRTLSADSVQTSWRYLVHAKFAERPYHKKNVFKRRRRLALALPGQQPVTVNEAILLTPELAREYGALTQRTLERDFDELVEMDIAVKETNGSYRANLGLLGSHMPARKLTNHQ